MTVSRAGELPPGQQWAAPGKWPLVGERDPAPPAGPWNVTLGGLVAHPQTWTPAELAALPQSSLTLDIHCVTRWSKRAVPFTGVRLADLLKLAGREAAARYVSFTAYSPRRHSTSLALDNALNLGVLVALTAEGQPLTAAHGGPVRVVTPERYFYKSLKWLAEITLLAEDRLGYWEAAAGYHNHADPWQEQRYMAPDLDRREAARLIAARNFSGQTLRSIDCQGRDLAGLQAAGAVLRDADFRRANLAGADFRGANLTNARLSGANLTGARLSSADLQGVDFSGAVLAGADLTASSVFGASFTSADHGPAQVDANTRLDAVAGEELTPEQAAWLEGALRVCGGVEARSSGLPTSGLSR